MKKKAPSWAALKGFGGSGKNVPALVKRLSDKSEQKRTLAIEALGPLLVGEGKWCPAAAPAVALLLASLPKIKEPGWVVDLVAEIVCGQHRHAFRSDAAKGPPARVVEAVAESYAAVESLAKSKDALVRQGFTMIAMGVPSLFERTRPALSKLLKDKEPTVRIGAILALARLGEGNTAVIAELRKLAKDRDEGVRGAVAVAELRLCADVAIADRLDGLALFLAYKPPEKQTLLWYRGKRADVVVDIVERRGEGDALVDTLIDAAASLSGTALCLVTELVLVLGGFASKQARKRKFFVVPAAELIPEQRAIVQKLAHSKMLPIGAFGIPACGAPRRRWLGIDPPGPSDRPVRITLEKKRYDGPFWQVCDAVAAERNKRILYASLEPPPQEVVALLEGADRWQALIELSQSMYAGGGINWQHIDPLLAELPFSADIEARAPSVAAELLEQQAAGCEDGRVLEVSVDPGPSRETAALFFLPFVRAKAAWPAAWDALIAFESTDKWLAEIASGLPLKRREALVQQRLDRAQQDSSWGELYLDQVVDIYRASPDKSILDMVKKRRLRETVEEMLAPPSESDD